MAQQNAADDAAQPTTDADPVEGDYVRISEDAANAPGRVGQVVSHTHLEGNDETLYTVSVDGLREGVTFTDDSLTVLGEWAGVASTRVRELVGHMDREAGVGNGFTVEKAGDTGVIIGHKYDGGRFGRGVFESAELHGFEVAEVNFNEETVLLRDPARVED